MIYIACSPIPTADPRTGRSPAVLAASLLLPAGGADRSQHANTDPVCQAPLSLLGRKASYGRNRDCQESYIGLSRARVVYASPKLFRTPSEPLGRHDGQRVKSLISRLSRTACIDCGQLPSASDDPTRVLVGNPCSRQPHVDGGQQRRRPPPLATRITAGLSPQAGHVT